MDVNTSYEPYSQEPEYIDVNRDLVRSLDIGDVRRVADLACGTGLLSDLLLDRRGDLAIYGVDLDPHQIEIARRQFAKRAPLAANRREWDAASGGAILLEVGSADSLPVPDGVFDLAVIGNAIHLMPDKDRFLAEVHRILRPGGSFAFNSVFFAGTFPPGTEHIYTEWIKEAVLVLDELNQARAKAGEPPIRRKRGRGSRAFKQGYLSEEGWRERVEASGMRVARSGKREVTISRRGLKLVGAYGGLAEVLMSGYPVEIASECLQEAVDRAFDRLEIEAVGRYWLEIVATKE